VTYIVEAAPFNGPDDADAAMTWVDISGYVNDNLSPISTNSGRQTELEQVDVGRMSLVLNNADHRFTAGNPTSPYYPGWRTGMRIRVRESVGPRIFTHFDGNMLQPDLTIQTPGIDQTVTVNAVDRIGRLGQARKFLSTLTEYIRYSGGPALKGYWPLNDPAGSLVARQVSRSAFTGLAETGEYLGAAPTSVGELIVFGGSEPPPGDDANLVQFNPVIDPITNVVVVMNRLTNHSVSVSMNPAVNPYVTLAGWFNLDPRGAGGQPVAILTDSTFANSISIEYHTLVGGVSNWLTQVHTAAGGTAVQGPNARFGVWDFVAVRVNTATSAIDLWVNDNPVVSDAVIGGAASGTVDGVVTEGGSPGQGLGHIQIYAGASADFDQAKFNAQLSQGWQGLRGQFAGDRIATLARYAGISPADVAIDQGTAAMQKASLAGKTPLAAMQAAADADRGLLHADGRRLIFHSRKRRYDL
jgi:hypothetical protein